MQPQAGQGFPADCTRWLVVTVQAPPRGEEPLLVDALRRQGARLVERDGERFVAHLPAPPDPEPLLRDVEAAVRASTSLGDAALSWRWRSEGEWEARWAREAGPRRIGERIVVTPGAGSRGDGAGNAAPSRPGDVVIRLAPGLAFGTAEHPTTRSCLRLMEPAIGPGDRVVDIGAGSGILSIAAALLGARRVLALEADGGACADARRNVALNGVADRVEVRQIEVRPRTLGRLRGDGVLANLHPDLLIPLLPGLARLVRRRGWAIVSGVPRTDRDAVVEGAAEVGLAPAAEVVEEGWWTGRLGLRP